MIIGFAYFTRVLQRLWGFNLIFNSLSVFDHSVVLALKWLNPTKITFALLISNTLLETVSLPLKTQKFFCVSNSEASLWDYFKKGALKNLSKFTGKHLCWSLFWMKLLAEERLQTTASEASNNKCNYELRCMSVVIISVVSQLTNFIHVLRGAVSNLIYFACKCLHTSMT